MHLIRYRPERSAPALTSAEGTVATIGNFDGVHRGHRSMLDVTRARAAELGVPSTVISFEPLPHEFFAGEEAPRRLQGLRDRVASLDEAGMDRLLLLPFDQRLASQTADAFAHAILVNLLQVRHLVIGDDFRFGSGRRGDHALLEAIGRRNRFSVSASPTVDDGSGRISSSRIRAHLCETDLPAAAALLGRPYRISGRVIHGEKVGRQLGFPTANVRLGQHRPPLRGVFAVRATDRDSGTVHDGVANLGERPTVGGRKLLLEVNVLAGAPELYGHHLAVDFLHFIRGELRFGSLDELKAQIGADAASARRLLAGPA